MYPSTIQFSFSESDPEEELSELIELIQDVFAQEGLTDRVEKLIQKMLAMIE